MNSFQEIYRKYTRAGPNYQCYPTTLGFQDQIIHDNIIKKFDVIQGRNLNLQFLFPFSFHLDSHSTSYQIQIDDNLQAIEYISYIKKEILIYKNYIKNNNIVEIHFSGNEILFLQPSEFNTLLEFISQNLSIDFNDIVLSLDVNARRLDSKKLETLKRIGFNKLRISTLNFDQNLQVSLSDFQSYLNVKQVLNEVKKLKFDHVCIDLYYGLPKDSFESMKATIESLLASNFEQICLLRYFHRPFIFNFQKSLDSNLLPTNEQTYLIFKMCLDKLLSAGYKHLGMNCFVNINSDLYSALETNSLCYNYSGYTCNEINDVVSLGASLISKVNGLHYQNIIDIENYYKSIDRKKIPVAKGVYLNTDHILRKNIIKKLITQSCLSIDSTNKFHFNSLEGIKESYSQLYEMEKEGMVIIGNLSIKITDLGKYFLKNICALFDLNMRELF